MAIKINNVTVIDDSRNLTNIGSGISSTSPTVNLLNGTTTSVTAFSTATAVTLGNVAGSSATMNIASGVTGSGATKTVNIGTGGAAGSTTNVSVGSSSGGTTTINSPMVNLTEINASGSVDANRGFGGGSTLSVSVDGTIQIAGTTSAINGTYMIRATGANREHFMIVNVNAQPFGGNFISVVANHAFANLPLLSNLRISRDAGDASRYFLLDIGNRAGSAISILVTAIGPLHKLNLIAVPTSTTASSTTTSLFTGFAGNVLVNTQVDDLLTKLQVNGNISATALSLSDDLRFTSLAQRITGNMTDGVPANRLAFQSSVVNGFTDLTIAPNGSSQIAAVSVWNSSSLANAPYGQLQANANAVDVISGRIGSGAYLPLRFSVNAAYRLIIDTDGNSDFSGNVAVNGGNLTSTAATVSVFNTNAINANIAGSALTINVGGTTLNSIANFATGATVSGSAKSVSIGTGGQAGSTTNVFIGSGQGGTTRIASPNVTFSATSANNIDSDSNLVTLLASPDNVTAFNRATFLTLGNSTGSTSVSIANGATASGSTKNVNIARNGIAGSTTNVTIGSVVSAGSISLLQNTSVTGTINASGAITGSRLNVGSVTSTPTVPVASGQAFHSGWTRLTNNVVMAWGISVPVGIDTTIDVTFPVTFSTVFTVMPSMHNTNGSTNDDVFAKTINFTTSGATFRTERTAGSEGGTRYVHYVVIGIIN